MTASIIGASEKMLGGTLEFPGVTSCALRAYGIHEYQPVAQALGKIGQVLGAFRILVIQSRHGSIPNVRSAQYRKC
jgi:hypothetical protein